jgi:CBS domain-containing protein
VRPPQLYRHLPVVAPDDGSLRGILTVRDLLRPAGKLWEPIAHLWDATPVEEILASTVGAGAPALVDKYSIDSKRMVADAVVQMARHTLNFLVAVDTERDGEIKGVLMERHYVNFGSKVGERAGAQTNSTNQGIESIMSPRAEMLSAPAGMSGSKCLDIMLENNIRCAPVETRARARRGRGRACCSAVGTVMRQWA